MNKIYGAFDGKHVHKFTRGAFGPFDGLVAAHDWYNANKSLSLGHFIKLVGGHYYIVSRQESRGSLISA